MENLPTIEEKPAQAPVTPRKAAKALEDLLLRGYTEWELKVQRERERTRRVADEISSHFKTPWYATRMERKADADAMGTSKPKMLKGLRWGLMGYAQMMLALRKKLGKVFCDRQRRTIAEAHRNLLRRISRVGRCLILSLRES